MANYATLKTAIQAVIKENGTNAITGNILQSSLLSMIESLGSGYQFIGVATAATDPGTPDQRVFYLASAAGIYANFNNANVPWGISVLRYATSWELITLVEFEGTPTAGSNKLITSGAAYNLRQKTRFYFSPVWRDDRRLYWDFENQKIYIRGTKTAVGDSLVIFNSDGKSFNIKDTVTEKTFTGLSQGNVSFHLPIPSGDAGDYTLNDIVAVNGGAVPISGHLHIAQLQYLREMSGDLLLNIPEALGVADNAVNIANEAKVNPILKNHTTEIRYRGTAQLCWDDVNRKLYWTNGVTSDSAGSMIHLNYLGKTVRLGIGQYKEKTIPGTGNVKLYLPVPVSGESQVYTLNDLIITEDEYAADSYVKIAHITFGNAISSFICKKEVKDNVIVGIKNDINDAMLRIADITPGYDYVQNLIINGTIGDDGILATYVGRSAVFYKLPGVGNAPTIVTDANVAAYQWYSGFPDYINGSNSLGRTTTNTPPANAAYGGLTFATGNPTTLKISGSTYIDDSRETLGRYGSALNNSVGENNFANELRTNLKILGYGNSFMRNSVAYLSAIAKGCGVNLVVGNLYTGGTYLLNHYNALLNNSADYEFYKYVDGVQTVGQSGQTPMRGLLEERWDAIILHQYNVQNHPFEPVLNDFIKLIIERLGYCPKIYINATWAYHEDYIAEYVSQYYDSETEMWSDMMDKCQKACEDSGILKYSIIPTGTAIQNARTLSWADDYIRFCNGGDDLHHLNPAGGFIAACTVFQKIVSKLNGIPCSNTTFRITSPTSMPPQTDVQPGILVTDSNYLAMCKCAIDAVENPNVITQQ